MSKLRTIYFGKKFQSKYGTHSEAAKFTESEKRESYLLLHIKDLENKIKEQRLELKNTHMEMKEYKRYLKELNFLECATCKEEIGFYVCYKCQKLKDKHEMGVCDWCKNFFCKVNCLRDHDILTTRETNVLEVKLGEKENVTFFNFCKPF